MRRGQVAIHFGEEDAATAAGAEAQIRIRQ